MLNNTRLITLHPCALMVDIRFCCPIFWQIASVVSVLSRKLLSQQKEKREISRVLLPFLRRSAEIMQSHRKTKRENCIEIV